MKSESAAAYADIAGRFHSVGRLFTTLGNPANTELLLENLLSPDPKGFERWVRELDLPFAGKCLWLRDLVERVVSSPPRLVTECRIREDLTPRERVLLFMISWRHGQVTVSYGFTVVGSAPVIPEGPYLDELKANGLVKCEDRWVSDTVTTVVLGPPQRVCF